MYISDIVWWILICHVIITHHHHISALKLLSSANICISVRNPLSDYETRDKIAFNLTELIESEENSKEPPCHFCLKWEGAKKRSTLTVLSEAQTKTAFKKKKFKDEFSYTSYTSDHNGNFVPILAVECRGIEPYAFHGLGDEFLVESESGNVFDKDVDLSEGDWADYDEENDASVSVSEFEAKFESL